ncbi:MAG: hypothetical protein H5T99_13255, partial [Moorella sp. (in: Bacteria)]|nr:hypothetical protein [Moorella sp. (in: firmicutes)]
MAMAEEEAKRQVAAGEEGPGPYRGFDPLIQYLLHRLDAMEASLRTEMTGLRSEITALRQDMRDEIGGLRNDISQVHEETHRLEVSME